MKPYDAIVLAGGGGRRLGGVDKATIQIGASSLLARAMAAVETASCTIVVGPPRSLPSGVVNICETPPGGGPVAAISAALKYVGQPRLVVLACDMPLVSVATVARLLTGHDEGTDGALLIDEEGRRQPLCAVYGVTALRSALNRLQAVDGASMRALTGHLTLAAITAAPGETADCDTWDDVNRSRALLEET